jgi:hypothetical protein
MEPVDLSALAADPEPIFMEIAKHQPEYQTLPALVYRDGKVLIVWALTEEERTRLIRGEHLRLWVWVYPTRCDQCGVVRAPTLQPVALEVTRDDG